MDRIFLGVYCMFEWEQCLPHLTRFHCKRQSNKCCTSTTKRKSRKQHVFALLLFFFACKIKTYSAENQIKDASPCQTASLIIYLNEHNRKHTGEEETQTLDTGGWHGGSAV